MRLALAGTGQAARDLLIAAQQTENVEVIAIYHHNKNPGPAQELADSYSVAEVYGDYAEMLRQTRADFIYIALVNSAHYDFAREALEKKFNVIVEKPLCPTGRQARELAELANKNDLFLFEAVTTLHAQNYKSLRESIKQIGNIHMVLCNFSQKSGRYDNYWAGRIAPAFDPAHYGGALYDINVYNINFVVDLFGPPDDVGYYANLGYNDVDLSGTVILQYPYFHAVCTGAKDSTSPGYLIVQGDRGYLKIDGNPNSAPKIELNINGRSGVYRLNRYEHRMVHELVDFETVWREKNFTRARYWLETAVAVAETLERAAASAGLEYGSVNVAVKKEAESFTINLEEGAVSADTASAGAETAIGGAASAGAETAIGGAASAGAEAAMAGAASAGREAADVGAVSDGAEEANVVAGENGTAADNTPEDDSVDVFEDIDTASVD